MARERPHAVRTDDPLGAQIVGGLIDHRQIPGRERAGQLRLDRDPLPRRRLHARLVEDVGVFAGVLRGVERHVGVCAQLLGRLARSGGDPDADADRHLRPDLLGQIVWLAQNTDHALGDELGAGIERRALDQDDELIAGQASGGVRLPHHRAQPLGDHLQKPVADAVPVRVVNVLEIVEVDVEKRHRRP